MSLGNMDILVLPIFQYLHVHWSVKLQKNFLALVDMVILADFYNKLNLLTQNC